MHSGSGRSARCSLYESEEPAATQLITLHRVTAVLEAEEGSAAHAGRVSGFAGTITFREQGRQEVRQRRSLRDFLSQAEQDVTRLGCSSTARAPAASQETLGSGPAELSAPSPSRPPPVLTGSAPVPAAAEDQAAPHPSPAAPLRREAGAETLQLPSGKMGDPPCRCLLQSFIGSGSPHC